MLLDTLTLSDNFVWVNEFDWSPVAQEAERSLTGALVGKKMSLTLPDGRSFTVIFDRADGPPIEAQQVLPLSAPSDDHLYIVVIRLMSVSPVS